MGSATIWVGMAWAVSMASVACMASMDWVAAIIASAVAAMLASAVEAMAAVGVGSSIIAGVAVPRAASFMGSVTAAPGSGSSTARVMNRGERRYQATGRATTAARTARP